MKRSLRLVAAAALALSACERHHGDALDPSAVGGSAGTSSGGALAADFSLRDLNGSSVRLSALRGKVVLLNFWFLK